MTSKKGKSISFDLPHDPTGSVIMRISVNPQGLVDSIAHFISDLAPTRASESKSRNASAFRESLKKRSLPSGDKWPVPPDAVAASMIQLLPVVMSRAFGIARDLAITGIIEKSEPCKLWQDPNQLQKLCRTGATLMLRSFGLVPIKLTHEQIQRCLEDALKQLRYIQGERMRGERIHTERSANTKEKIGDSRRGKKHSPETKSKLKLKRRIQPPPSEATKVKIAVSQRGNQNRFGRGKRRNLFDELSQYNDPEAKRFALEHENELRAWPSGGSGSGPQNVPFDENRHGKDPED
ncbi:MAG: hypothetical protein HY650_06195 [Acidobacteria bacterium]|nr:hypothetical protein [Acidobacteriota bacterium]